MNKARAVFSHLTVILSLAFIVFLVLDQFNPMMNFVDNSISRWMLGALCVSGIMQSILHWKEGECGRIIESSATADSVSSAAAAAAGSSPNTDSEGRDHGRRGH